MEHGSQQTRVAIQGFGNVGGNTARFLQEQGACVVAASDAYGGLFNADGLDVGRLYQATCDRTTRSRLQDIDVQAERIANAELLALDVDVLIPAAVSDAIHKDNADKIRARLVVEAANLPTTPEGADILDDRGIPVIPDILANAGGVSVSYLEWVQNRQRYRWSKDRVNGELADVLQRAWQSVMQRAAAESVNYRLAAYLIAVERVKEAIDLRGF